MKFQWCFLTTLLWNIDWCCFTFNFLLIITTFRFCQISRYPGLILRILSFIQTFTKFKGSSAPVYLVWACWLYLPAWPDPKQPLNVSWTKTEMENGVMSNQRCCHDYVQFTPTCNQATGRAATKLMWQLQVDWKWTDGKEAWVDGWVKWWTALFFPGRLTVHAWVYWTEKNELLK